MSFTLYTPETAPQAAQGELKNSAEVFGWVPNLHAVLAQAPPVLTAYKSLHALFQQSSFDAEELTVVWQSINLENTCHYCVPAHTTIAGMMEVDGALISALLEGKALPTKKLEVLKDTTRALLNQRGDLTDEQVADFKAVGYDNQQLLEI
ncbi:carboxymuconolactone decarboxylase, partial [Gammaproteobacteria bacterium 54_18_T64]